MSVLGSLLKNRRSDETLAAWNQANLQSPEALEVTSRDFKDGGPMPKEHHAKPVGGRNLSPHLAWRTPPSGTAQLLLVVEDIDVPMSKPAVHCVALIDPASGPLETGALAAKAPAAGVTVLRSAIGRGYHGPAPIKGHGPHRYTFQVFALGSAVDLAAATRARPRAFLATVTAPVLARGRITGTVER